MSVKVDSGTASRLRDKYLGDPFSEENPSSEPVQDNPDHDGEPARLDSTGNDTGRITFTAKDRKKIEEFLHSLYPVVAGAVAMRCADCGQMIGGCEDAWCDAAAGALITRWPSLASRMLQDDGPVNMDFVMLALLTMQMGAAVAHHHVPVLRDREPPVPDFDPLQPEVPWQQ
jgi:hypothetical protein